MNELEELIALRKEIDKKISTLRKQKIESGRAFFRIEHLKRGDIHKIEYNAKNSNDETYCRSRVLFYGNTREEAMEAIPEIINDLQGLYDMMKEDSE